MSKIAMSEILSLVEKATTLEDKIRILRQNRSQPFVDVLQGAFDDRIIWLLPEGPVPYKPSREQGISGILYAETRKLRHFVRGGNPALSQTKRETLFIQLLEAIDPLDAKLLEYVKDKKLPYPSITYELLRQAFPDVNIVHVKHVKHVNNDPSTLVVKDAAPVKPKPKRDRSRPRADPNRPYSMDVRNRQMAERRAAKEATKNNQPGEPTEHNVQDKTGT